MATTKTETLVTEVSKLSERSTTLRATALVVIYGEDLGRKHDLIDEETIVGRSSKCQIVIDQESVSRNHAKLVTSSSGVTVEDMGSTNGTFLNDERVASPQRLRNGDFIKIGRSIFKFIGGNNIEAQYHEAIYRLTTTDGLTQAYNKRFFVEALDREFSRCRRYGPPLSLVMMDIDRFKLINDSFGHLAGDGVLKRIAEIIRENVRREDVFARYGGEEFALVLPEVELKGGFIAAEKLRKLIGKEAFVHAGRSIDVAISAGVASLREEHLDALSLIREADERLYAAKAAGRNRVIC